MPAGPRRRSRRLVGIGGAVVVFLVAGIVGFIATRDEGGAPPATTASPESTAGPGTTEPEAEVAAPYYGGATYFQQKGFGKNDFTKGNKVFPLGIWDGGASEASLWQQAGINLYVGQLYYERAVVDAAAQAGISVIGVDGALGDPASPAIVGWRPRNVNGQNNLWDDEPDLYKSDIRRCVPPKQFDAAIQRMKAQQPTLPTFVNLGFTLLQPLGWFTQNRGQGCDGKDGDFAVYTANADIVSADVYTRTVRDNGRQLPLTLVGELVTRTRAVVSDTKPVCSVIEAADIDGDGTAISAAEMRFTVFHSLVRGANCIIYFTIDSRYNEPKRILKTPDLLNEMTNINRLIAAEAQTLNGPPMLGIGRVEAGDGVEMLTKRTPDGGVLVIVTETTGKAQDATLRFRAIDTAAVTAQLGGVGAAVCDGRLPLRLEAYGVAMFRLRDQAPAAC